MGEKGPVGGIPEGGVPDPYRGYRVDEILGDRKRGSEHPPVSKEKKSLLSQLLEKLKKKLEDLFEKIHDPAGQVLSEKKALLALQDSLELLKLEDRSQDILFLHTLAKNWNDALESGLEKDEKTKDLFHLLIEKMSQYPKGQTYSFGYYLIEHAGQDWIPFPYMELIQKLHQEHEISSEQSSLTEWCRLIRDLLRIVDPFH